MASYYARPPVDPDSELLPSYEAATTRDPLPLVATSKYLQRGDVFRASLVSQSWRAAFMPVLWEAPHRYWGMGERSELTSFLFFMRTLSQIQQPVFYTRTLCLETVRPSIYTTLPPAWLSNILTKLPHLRVLTMMDFPFFDHVSLTATAERGRPHLHELQQLCACSSYNATAAGLCVLLPKLTSLRILDLSGSNGANHPTVLRAIAALPSLHTLALRDLKLDDNAVSLLAKAVGTRLRSLDLRGNLLTDVTATTLLNWCFAPPSYISGEIALVEKGLTHLRIAHNQLSITAATSFIKSARLVTLDLDRPRGNALQLVPALSMYAHSTLRTLRITHKVVMSPQGLRRRMLPRLKTLVLTGVPEWAGKREVDGLVEFISVKRWEEGDALEMLELEMVTTEETDDAGMLEGEFSFFDGDGQEGGSSWAGGKGRGWVETLREVKKARDTKRGWEGRVRIVRDLGGSEVRETGVEGERWGLVRERV